ncbi:MAG TPA: NifU family protein [Cyclobacteriaceae bacterium]|nr:NifU family protein [Cyclobacteriaceae bacterium]MCB9236752.1 NifU family protein [Flammeovirgaceae bacterium]MCB0500433.1 NifU family protein [Cyclobacteriaceae bacterium]MCO5272363.1 NifU family protein [Cyclobacteriaceae bacterium]MCW5902031.1 NifU family protein [Cyclobacteriaceae bacterium]
MTGKPKKDELNGRVEAALDNIRPYLVMDGGDVRILEITKDKKLILEFMGNCGTCPMSTMTFKAGVEEAIKRSVPEIGHIEVVNMPTV